MIKRLKYAKQKHLAYNMDRKKIIIVSNNIEHLLKQDIMLSVNMYYLLWSTF